jgi:hypothetical protein
VTVFYVSGLVSASSLRQMVTIFSTNQYRNNLVVDSLSSGQRS